MALGASEMQPSSAVASINAKYVPTSMDSDSESCTLASASPSLDNYPTCPEKAHLATTSPAPHTETQDLEKLSLDQDKTDSQPQPSNKVHFEVIIYIFAFFLWSTSLLTYVLLYRKLHRNSLVSAFLLHYINAGITVLLTAAVSTYFKNYCRNTGVGDWLRALAITLTVPLCAVTGVAIGIGSV
jgi:hypothetical protein